MLRDISFILVPFFLNVSEFCMVFVVRYVFQ